MRYLYKAVEINNRNPDALTSMGWCLMESDRMKEAERYLVFALNVSPNSFDANVHMASLMNKTGIFYLSLNYKNLKKGCLMSYTLLKSFLFEKHI